MRPCSFQLQPFLSQCSLWATIRALQWSGLHACGLTRCWKSVRGALNPRYATGILLSPVPFISITLTAICALSPHLHCPMAHNKSSCLLSTTGQPHGPSPTSLNLSPLFPPPSPSQLPQPSTFPALNPTARPTRPVHFASAGKVRSLVKPCLPAADSETHPSSNQWLLTTSIYNFACTSAPFLIQRL